MTRTIEYISEIPSKRSLEKVFKHIIELEDGAKPIIITPSYHHLRRHNKEIIKVIRELLEMGPIRIGSIPFTSSIILVKKKDAAMRMCIDYEELNKKTMKNLYPIPNINELVDKICGDVYFSKIYLRSGYHHIIFLEENIHKINF